MDPSVITSSEFGILWKNAYDPKEKWYAKPLVYTPSDPNTNGGKQVVFLASSANVIRTVDAVTGATVVSRPVQPPFLQSDTQCTDIPDFIGIIGTPIIDPNTETVYFFSKGYKDNASSGGLLAARYSWVTFPLPVTKLITDHSLYAVNINDLTDRPGFPVVIDGHPADNDHTRYFIAGTALQRPVTPFARPKRVNLNC